MQLHSNHSIKVVEINLTPFSTLHIHPIKWRKSPICLKLLFCRVAILISLEGLSLESLPIANSPISILYSDLMLVFLTLNSNFTQLLPLCFLLKRASSNYWVSTFIFIFRLKVIPYMGNMYLTVIKSEMTQ